MKKNLISRFNQGDTRLVISDYPEKTKRGEKNYGIAWYTKELLEPLAKDYGVRFVVFAETGSNNRPALHQKGRILVLRIFDQKHPTLFPRILKGLAIFNKIKYVDIHSEFCTNGGIKNFILLLPFVFLIKLTGKHITYYSHNVVTELDSIAVHLGYKSGSIPLKLLNLGLHVFYRTLGIIVDRFVVMDEAIYKRLCLFVDQKKVFLQPFWVEQGDRKVSRDYARAMLGVKRDEFLVLYFGFITYYKGADWLISAAKEILKQSRFLRLRFILAGGQAYSLKDKSYYQKFYKRVLGSVLRDPKISVTGFVLEDDISTYFKACDLVVFPYRGMIGSSGVLAHAVSFKKPFIVSRGMQEVFRNKDIKNCLDKYGVDVADVVFEYTPSSFAAVLARVQKRNFLTRLQLASSELASLRSKRTLIDKCYTTLYTAAPSKARSSLLSYLHFSTTK